MNRRVLLTAAVLSLTLINTGRADFVIDSFAEPAAPHSGVVGTPSTYAGPFTAPQVATSRTLSVTGAGIIATAGLGTFSTILLPGSAATITWALPALDLSADPVLEFVGFSIAGSTALVSAAINGTTGSISSQAWAGGAPPDIWLDHTSVSSVSTLSVTFTNTGGGLLTITGDAVVANPEPAAMTLIGLGMLGIGARYMRRRKISVADQTTAA